MGPHRFRMTVLLAYCVVLAACAAQVTSQGQTVVDARLVRAAQVIRGADLTAAAIADTLREGYQAGTIPPEVPRRYAMEIGPAIQVALDTARDALVVAIDGQDQTAMQTLNAAMTTLTTALNQAITLAQQYGADLERQEWN